MDFLPLFFFSLFFPLCGQGADRDQLSPPRLARMKFTSHHPFSPPRSLFVPSLLSVIRRSSSMSRSLSLSPPLNDSLSRPFFLVVYVRTAEVKRNTRKRGLEHVSQGERRESDKWLLQEVSRKRSYSKTLGKSICSKDFLAGEKGETFMVMVHDNG